MGALGKSNKEQRVFNDTNKMIEKGELLYPVSEITIAGNLNSIFQNIVLANDLELNYSTNSPTMLVTGMTVGGR